MERIPGAIPIMQNTDGLETKIPREYEQAYYEICKEWEQLTNLQLEHDTYSKIILRDVNNYIAVHNYKEVAKEVYDEIKTENPHYLYKEEGGKYYYGATKCKGSFDFYDIPLHKNKSFKVIPEAIYNYFVHGIEPATYLKTNVNIFDYCAGKKINGNWAYNALYLKGSELVEEPLQKTIRYYVSKSGVKLIKHNYSDDRKSQVEAGPWLQSIHIKHVEKPFDQYTVNHQFYLNKINKEISKLSPLVQQESLNF